MTNRQEDILNAVDRSIEALINDFQQGPTRFFTENDLVCCFHRLLHNSLDALDLPPVLDIDDLPHSLIHCEYATVFRCNMKGKGFTRMLDTDLTDNNGKFRRGHHDIVVLNPTFVRKHTFTAVKGQTYALMRDVLPKLTEQEPAFLYGIELVYRRDPIKPSKGGDRDAAAKRFVTEVKQDADKLKYSVESKHVMKKARMLAFLKGTTDDKVLDFIRSSLKSEPHVMLLTTQ